MFIVVRFTMRQGKTISTEFCLCSDLLSFSVDVCVCVYCSVSRKKCFLHCVVSYANRCMWKRFGICSINAHQLHRQRSDSKANKTSIYRNCTHKKSAMVFFLLCLYIFPFQINYIISHYTVGCFIEHTECHNTKRRRKHTSLIRCFLFKV